MVVGVEVVGVAVVGPRVEVVGPRVEVVGPRVEVEIEIEKVFQYLI